jgi:hypothetical protein
MNAAFQLVLDRVVGEWVCPPGWVVVSAGNPAEDYCVNSCFEDPAFLDRFCHLSLKPSAALAAQWSDWLAEKHGEVAEQIGRFATSHSDFLFGKSSGKSHSSGPVVKPSPRSWEAVTRVLIAAKGLKCSGTPLHRVIAGLVGTELATAFKKFHLPLTPREFLKAGSLKEIEGQLGRLTRDQLVALMAGLPRLLDGTVSEERRRCCSRLLDFAEWLAASQKDKDVILAFMRDLAERDLMLEGDSELKTALLTNARLLKAVVLQHPQSEDILTHLAARPALQKFLAEAAWGAAVPA